MRPAVIVHTAAQPSHDRAAAIAHYAKSVELNPGNENGQAALSRLRGYEIDAARLQFGHVYQVTGRSLLLLARNSTCGMYP